MSGVIIVGSGPAGISAALYTVRAGVETTVIAKGTGSLAKAERIDNYYGAEAGISGEELHARGLRQAERLGVRIISAEVVSVGYDGEFTVKTAQEEYRAAAVILATGSNRSTPRIQNIEKFELKGISYCAVCDSFFYRGKDVAVLGSGDYAMHEAGVLSNVAGKVTVLTNGEETSLTSDEKISVITKKIDCVDGGDHIECVKFTDGEQLPISGLFIAVGVAGSTSLARKLGAEISGNKIAVKEDMSTNLPGLFAAGDCIGGLMQISKSVADGAIAATSAIKFLKSK
ncbi:MAG: NAD(P)/FAD-dependent oxidoreductase [Oscillospiraceae bacterium]|jgi:thioredoxin reductase (NADPH)|nr:NAD(P)/FAD-dependent oxidoreductase [Oscillospiraceae bacterium]